VLTWYPHDFPDFRMHRFVEHLRLIELFLYELILGL